MSWLALIGYTAGALMFIAQNYHAIKSKHTNEEISNNQIVEDKKTVHAISLSDMQQHEYAKSDTMYSEYELWVMS